MKQLATGSAEQTKALAVAISGLLHEGDVIYLNGDLGAGKTAFTQGLAAALGFDGRVTSPTFALVQHYAGGSLTVHHVDAYRLTNARESEDLALDEILDGGGVMVIEWAERLGINLCDSRLEIEMLFGDLDDDRILKLQMIGDRWVARAAQIDKALAPWCPEALGDA